MSDTPPNLPPAPPAAIVRRKGLGCVPTGCLVVVILLMILGVIFGGFMWLFTQGGQAFVSEKPAVTRTVEANDQQYQDVLAKLAPFGQAMAEGKSATAEITPDDVNVLIARAPQFQFWRGKLFLEAQADRLTAEMSIPMNYEGTSSSYFNGRATFDASYASNGFALILRQLEPLDKNKGNTRFTRFLNHRSMLEAFSQQVSRGVNDNLRQQARKDPATADLLRKIRTVIVQDGKIVITTGGAVSEAESPAPDDASPGPEAPTPAPTPEATPSNQA